jgi:hypothetical protein
LYSFCNISPLDFWKYTPAETTLMITEANSRFEFEQLISARLCTVILNANGATKENKKRFEIKDFMPEEKSKIKKLTPEQYQLMMIQKTIAAGGTVNYR